MSDVPVPVVSPPEVPAAQTLVWEVAGRTYRLEGALTRDEAVRTAETLG